MLCRLTHSQFRQVEMRMPELYATTMREHRVTRGRTQHDYDLPAIAWRQILDEMMRVCFGPAGGKLKGRGRPADSAYLAIRRIGDTVRRIEGHPALTGRWVEGWVGDVIPAWASVIVSGTPGESGYMRATRLGDYRPYPTPEREFVLLLPQHETNLGMKVTRWQPIESALQPTSVMSSWTMAEASHLLFSAEHRRMYQARKGKP